LHTLIEAKKLAYADLDAFIADPATMRINVNSLLSDDFIRARRSQIDPKRAVDRPQPGAPVTASETIYLTAADSQGNMISFINSNYDLFGSGIVAPGLGFPLQNRGNGFTMTEGHPNEVAPRKRPLHTIIPAFVTKTTANGEEPFMSFGVMGGAMQPQGHVQVLLNLLVFGMDIQQAIDAARFRHLSGLNVALETPIGADVRSRLLALGHQLANEANTAFGGAQAIIRLQRGWVAGSDPRKDGMAAGH
jgi:gamma-glutamyltranspeptidase/glutathione hydrolase